MKLQIFLQKCGIGSRRKCADIIQHGTVTVNGETCTVFWHEVDVVSDDVEVDGKSVSLVEEKSYYILNKPQGYVCANSDRFGTPTVFDFIRQKYGVKERLHSVGRLDKNTTGLIILTNDGNLTNEVIHPSRNIDKVYKATVKGRISKEQRAAFENGLCIDGYITAPAKMEICGFTAEGDTEVRMTIHEGKKRQIRLMCRIIGHEVIELQRVSIGSLTLQDAENTGDLFKINGKDLYDRLGFNQKGGCSK